jgi:hypothetical protein
MYIYIYVCLSDNNHSLLLSTKELVLKERTVFLNIEGDSWRFAPLLRLKPREWAVRAKTAVELTVTLSNWHPKLKFIGVRAGFMGGEYSKGDFLSYFKPMSLER